MWIKIFNLVSSLLPMAFACIAFTNIAFASSGKALTNSKIQNKNKLRPSHRECHLVGYNNRKRPLNIVHFIPFTTTHGFWQIYTHFMQAVAVNLGINLEIIVIEAADNNRFYLAERIKVQLKGKRPDYVIGSLFRNKEKVLLDTMEALAIPFFSVNSSISETNLGSLGLPRQHYRYWLGHMSPDDFNAGHALAHALTGHRQVDQTFTMMAISGPTNSMIGQNRVAGLLTAVNQGATRRQTVNLLPVVHGDWQKTTANIITRSMLKRPFSIDLIWTVSAETATGVVDALQAQKIEPGKTIKIGTFDWSPLTLEQIKNGHVEVSFGGHFMEGGWALILLLDHANRLDFVNDLGVNIATQLRPLTKKNLPLFSDAISKQRWGAFDFKQLSKCFNPWRKKYQLDTDVLQAINRRQ